MAKEAKESIRSLLKAKPKRRVNVIAAKTAEKDDEVESIMESIKLFSKNERLSIEESANLIIEVRKLNLPFVHLNAAFDAKSFLMSGINTGIFIDTSGGIRESANHSIHGFISLLGGKNVEDDLTGEMKRALLEGKAYFDKYRITFDWFGENKSIVYYLREPFLYFSKAQEIRNGIAMLVLYDLILNAKSSQYIDKVIKNGLILYKTRIYVDPGILGFEKINEFFYDDGTEDSNYYGILRKIDEERISILENWLKLNEAISSLIFIKHEREEQLKTRLTIGKYQEELESVDSNVEKIREVVHKLSKNEKESLRKIIDEFIINQKTDYGGRLEQNLKALVSYVRTKLSELGLEKDNKK